MLYLDIVDIIIFFLGMCAGAFAWEVLKNGRD